MKITFKIRLLTLLAVVICLASVAFKEEKNSDKVRFKFPYKQAGLSERQAAAHLLSRFTFGATPGQVDDVTNIGLEKWLMQQLNAGLPDDSLNEKLKNYEALNLTNTQIVNTYPRNAYILKMAIEEGIINKDSVDKNDKKQYKDQVQAYMQQKGFKPENELFRQLFNQKILKAAYSNNQLQELLTDFWFNHFNVSLTKNDCSQYVLAYERDAIRPNVFGKFENLLLATAKNPAMLLYLDNFSSAGTNDQLPNQQNPERLKKLEAMLASDKDMDEAKKADLIKKIKGGKKPQGLNENYAREVMELHTLGVDGGYTQQDVTQAARVLTGWTIYPTSDYGAGNAMRKVIKKIGEDKLIENGFVHEGDFLFTANRHDTKEKTVLGKTFAANGGYNEGVQLLQMLAHHPATAKFICKKIATRFVSDNPPQSLIDKMATTFLDKNGDLKQVIITMATAPEFWSKDAIREKTKSPFEFAISTLRSLNAQINQPYQVYNWITKMGQKLYYYQAPTGYPDKGQYWINTGSLLNRMNFGLAVASSRIPGISFSLAALNNNREPESAEAALMVYSKLLMPERNVDETIKRLTPMLNDPNLIKKVDEAAGKTIAITELQANKMQPNNEMMMEDIGIEKPEKEKLGKKNNNKNNLNTLQLQTATGNNSMLGQVVGVIIGSPEFQRK